MGPCKGPSTLRISPKAFAMVNEASMRRLCGVAPPKTRVATRPGLTHSSALEPAVHCALKYQRNRAMVRHCRRIAEKHDHAAVWGKRRTFVVETLSQDALAGPIRLHHPDGEFVLPQAGEGNVIAARRPDRRGVAAIAEADALGRAAGSAHHINLLATATIGFKADARAVGRVRRRRVDRLRVSQPRRRLGT